MELRSKELVVTRSLKDYLAHQLMSQAGLSFERRLELLLDAARTQGASAILLRPTVSGLDICFRNAGRLQLVTRIAGQQPSPLTTYIKLRAKLVNRPQAEFSEGSFIYQDETIRAAVAPTIHGSSIWLGLRLAWPRDLAELGLLPVQYELVAATLAEQRGLVLLSGPLGAGLSVTIASLLAALPVSTRIINLIDNQAVDPIRLPGHQLRTSRRGGLLLAAAIDLARTQKPEVLVLPMLTDRAAMVAALAAAERGILILVRAPGNSAAQALSYASQLTPTTDTPRLANQFRLSLYQRLQPRLTAEYAAVHQLTERQQTLLRRRLGLAVADFYSLCQKHQLSVTTSGQVVFKRPNRRLNLPAADYYQGREALFELLEADRGLVAALAANSAPRYRTLTTGGQPSLSEVALIKALAGKLSLETLNKLKI